MIQAQQEIKTVEISLIMELMVPTLNIFISFRLRGRNGRRHDPQYADNSRLRDVRVTPHVHEFRRYLPASSQLTGDVLMATIG